MVVDAVVNHRSNPAEACWLLHGTEFAKVCDPVCRCSQSLGRLILKASLYPLTLFRCNSP